MFNNFRTASLGGTPVLTADKIEEVVNTLQDDILKLGSISEIRANPRWIARAGQLIRQVVVDQFAMSDPVPLFTERREGRLGDTIEFEQLHNTLRVVRFAPHSKPQTFTPRKSKYTISTAMYELAFGLPLFKVLTRQHTVGEYTAMAAEAVARHRTEGVLSAIDTACSTSQKDPKGRDVRTNAGAADVSEAQIKAALRQMVAVNSQVTIFGSRYALQPIMEFAQSEGGDSMKDEFQRRGVIGTYRGARLVVLEDDYNEFYEQWTLVNGADVEKRIFLAGERPGTTLLERDLSAFDWEEVSAREGQFETGLRLDWGTMVHTPWRYHVIALT